MESGESITYLALSDSRPGPCGSKVARRASFEDIEALAGGLPMLSQRSYRIGSEQGLWLLGGVIDEVCPDGFDDHRGIVWMNLLLLSVALQ
jgi:hypothetical protein